MNKYLLYKRAWIELETPTPLVFDCGTLCNKVCCDGGNDQGMLLFPGEEVLYKKVNKNWFELVDSNILINNNKCKLFVCNSNCPRKYRPLACRIFPILPIIQNNKIELSLDYRGNQLCPLVQHSSLDDFSPMFKRKVKNVFYRLMKDKDVIAFLNILSHEQLYLKKFLG